MTASSDEPTNPEGNPSAAENVAAAIESFVRRNYGLEDKERFFRRDIDLAGRGYIDSIGVLETLAFIDETFAVRITTDDLAAHGSFEIDALTQMVTGTERVTAPRADLVEGPDRNEVADLLVRAGTEPCWYYRTELLDGYLDRPSAADALHLASYHGSDLAASCAAIPYEVRYRGATIPVLQGAFWVANPQFAGRGAGPAILEDTMARARESAARYSAFVAVTETGSTAARLLELTQGPCGLRRIGTTRLLITTPEGILCQPEGDPTATPDATLTVRRYEPADRKSCSELFAVDDPRLEVAKRIPAKDIDFVLAQRHDSATWVALLNGSIRAVLNTICTIAQHPTGDRVTALVENLAMFELSEVQRQEFLGAVFRDPYWADAELLTVQAVGSAVPDLRQLGFFPSAHEFSIYLLPFDDRLDIRGDLDCKLDLL